MRISISGSHSTGKSTLIRALKEIPSIAERFVIKDEVLRDIKKLGININEYGTDSTQLLVMSKFLEYSTIPNTILDRCALDGLVYTTYLYEKNQVKKSTLRIAEAIFENVRYDLYFYIAPEFNIVPDGVRSENFEFRDRVAELFEEYMVSYKLNAIRLTGSVKERVAQFIETLAAYDNWMKLEKKEKDAFIQSLILNKLQQEN